MSTHKEVPLGVSNIHYIHIPKTLPPQSPKNVEVENNRSKYNEIIKASLDHLDGLMGGLADCITN